MLRYRNNGNIKSELKNRMRKKMPFKIQLWEFKG